jgi:hypothetical protein
MPFLDAQISEGTCSPNPTGPAFGVQPACRDVRICQQATNGSCQGGGSNDFALKQKTGFRFTILERRNLRDSQRRPNLAAERTFKKRARASSQPHYLLNVP